MPECGSKTSTVPVVWAILEFFRRDPNDFLSRFVTRDETCYITMTQRQSNNQWSGGIAAYPTPKNSECKNPLENSRREFLGSRRHPPQWLSSKGPNYERRVLLICAGATEGYFEEKTHAAGSSPREFCSCTTIPRRTGHFQPRRDWPTWASSFLITHSILRIWPRRTTTCSLDWKTIEKSPFFVRRGGHCCRGDLIGRTKFWFFFCSGLHKLEQRAKKCIELRGDYVE